MESWMSRILFLCSIVVVNGGIFFPRGRTTTSLSIPHPVDVNTRLHRRIHVGDDNDAQLTTPFNTVDEIMQIIPRGGEISIEKDEGTFIMRKVRNTIRSFLKVTSKKAPPLAFIMRSVWSITEKITGLHLLPRDEDVKQKSKTKQKKRNKSVDDGEGKVAKKKDRQTKKKKQQQMQKSSSSGQVQSHLSKNIKTTNPNYRIQRELKEFLKSPPPNLSVRVGKNIRIWIITMVGTKGSLYEGEKYRLRVQFPANYPTEPPSVYFLQPTPKHEHVYTNGDICLSLLGKDWRPNMTAQSIAMSILSILSGASRKSIPMDNAGHSQNKPGQKQDDWVYHDDNC